MKKSRITSLLCALLLLTACGKGGAAGEGAIGGVDVGNGVAIHGNGQGEGGTGIADSNSQGGHSREWVYMPELIVLEDNRADYGDMYLNGDTLCYVPMPREDGGGERNVCRYSLNDKTFTTIPINWQPDGAVWEMGAHTFDQDFNLFMIANVYPADYSHLRRFLCKFDSEGKNIYSREVTEQLGSGISIGGIAVDGQGRIYAYTSEYTEEAGIWLYEADGSFHTRVSYDTNADGTAASIGTALASTGGALASIGTASASIGTLASAPSSMGGTSGSESEAVRVKGIASKEDGGFYFCTCRGENPDYCTLSEVDFESGQLTTVIEEFPSVNGLCVDTTGQYDFLIYDNTALYGYHLSGQKENANQPAEELFVWTESNVNGYYVTSVKVAADGRYFCTVEDWWNDDRCIVFLEKTKAEDAPKRVYMTLAAVDGGNELDSMAVKFNRSNSQYRITVRNFESLTDLYNAILAREAIDIIDLSGLDVEKLVKQGILENLEPYLEQSEKYRRSDFLEGLLEAYTFDGVLTGIPEAFTQRTLVGDRTMLGGQKNLTLEGLLEIAESNPDALPFDGPEKTGMTREEAMQYIMMFNEDTFIDEETGECHFDSEIFREVLELVGRMPGAGDERRQNGGSEPSLPSKIQNGEILFAVADLNRFRALQFYEGIFGENAACIGFPAPEGKRGTLLTAENAFGITAVSSNKDGAWQFLESVLARQSQEGVENDEIYMLAWLDSRLPSQKRILDIKAKSALEEDAAWAAEGRAFHGHIYEDGWTYEGHALTQEEVDTIVGLSKGAKPAFSMENNEIIRIINEEAPAYYSGQKSAEDVANIIQNRVQLYVDENF